MKKICSKIVALMMVLSATFVCGCSSSSKETEKDVMLMDFERWETSFQSMRLYNDFGKVSRNKDAQFVRSGKYSAKLQPVGNRIKVSKPCVVLPLSSELNKFDYTDITEFKEISAYAYNDSDKAIDVTVGLTAGFGDKTVSNVVGDKTHLLPKTWTRVSYVIDCNFLSILTDVENVAGLYFEFPDTGVVYPEDAPSIYLDDVKLSRVDSPVSINVDFNLKSSGELYQYVEGTFTPATYSNSYDYAENKWTPGEGNWTQEIMDFENIYQSYAVMTDATEETGEVKVVNAADYGVEASSGEKVLSVTRYNTSTTSLKFYVPSILMKAAGIRDVPVEKWKEVYLAFDMYNNGTEMQYHNCWKTKAGNSSSTGVQRVLRDKNNDGAWTLMKNNYYTWAYPKPDKKWTTWRVSLYELAYNSRNAVDADYVTNPGDLTINFASTQSGKNWQVFVDNIRLEAGPLLANGEQIIKQYG